MRSLINKAQSGFGFANNYVEQMNKIYHDLLNNGIDPNSEILEILKDSYTKSKQIISKATQELDRLKKSKTEYKCRFFDHNDFGGSRMFDPVYSDMLAEGWQISLEDKFNASDWYQTSFISIKVVFLKKGRKYAVKYDFSYELHHSYEYDGQQLDEPNKKISRDIVYSFIVFPED